MDNMSKEQPDAVAGAKQFVDRQNGILADFRLFSLRYLDRAKATISESETYLNRFFAWLRKNPGNALEPKLVQNFVFQYAKDHGPGSCRWMQFSLRSFLKYCYLKKHLPTNLAASVPTVRLRRLATVPFILDEDTIQRVLQSIERSTALGLRDYAIIQLLRTYGVRGIQIRQLKLRDISWQEDKIVFGAVKGGKPIVQHLTDEVGNSLVDYIQCARDRNAHWEEVFLTNRKPFKPFLSSGSFSSIVSRRLRAAAVDLPQGVCHGGHIFRHAFASRMLAHGQPLKNIGDMLGHRDPHSTFVYTKIDFKGLKETTLKWPEAKS